MENFSTPRPALVPRIANLATLAAVVAATWWSGAQRPVDVAAEAALQAPAMIPAQTSIETKPFAPELSTAAPTDLFAPAPTAAQAHWSTQSQPLPRDGLQAVGFATTARR